MNPLTDTEIDPIAQIESDPATAQAQSPAVVVVHHYRPQRWWSALLPPALLLLLASGVLSYRIWAPDWVGWSSAQAPFGQTQAPASSLVDEPLGLPEETLSQVAPLEPSKVDPSTKPVSVPAPAAEGLAEASLLPANAAEPEAVPVTVDVSPEPEETTEAIDEVEPGKTVVSIKGAADPLVLTRDEPNGAAVSGVLAATEPTPVAEAVVADQPVQHKPPAGQTMADMARAANAIHDDRAELENLKADLLDDSRKEDVDEQMEARKAFHAQIREILKDLGRTEDDRLAAEIRALTDKSGKPNPGLVAGMIAFGQRRTSRVERIRWLRKANVAESEILRQLEQDQLRNRVARTGPKSDSEATLRAARDLLAVALTSDFKPTPELKPVKPAAPVGRQKPGQQLRYPVSSRR